MWSTEADNNVLSTCENNKSYFMFLYLAQACKIKDIIRINWIPSYDLCIELDNSL